MNIIVRAMQENDWNEVAMIYQEGIDTGIATFQTEVPSYENWDRAHVKSCRFVAVADGRVIGWTALTPCSSRCVFAGVVELSVYIKKEFRGRQVGEKLMKETIIESEKEGFWSIMSMIMEENQPSIALHSKTGFRMIGYREKIGKDSDGKWRNTVMMERRSMVVGV
jgi:phosphinothricin acetyltransferase